MCTDKPDLIAIFVLPSVVLLCNPYKSMSQRHAGFFIYENNI